MNIAPSHKTLVYSYILLFYFIVCTDNPSVTVTSDRVTCIENDQLSLKGLYFLSAYICEGDNIKVLNDLCTIWRQ